MNHQDHAHGRLPNYAARLNTPQREAVLTTEGPVLILAGAGTGKTAALTARMAHLIAMRLAWPSEILCVTFTNKAAREMRTRVGQHIGDAVEGMPWLGTFHSICAKMLRRHAETVGLESNFTIIDTNDQLRLLKTIIQEAGLDEKRWSAKLLAACIDDWKNKGKSPGDINAAESESFANGRGGEFYALYQNRLRALNACDFGDLLLHMLTIFRTHTDILKAYQDRFKYIMVDEYQDTNQVQYLWLRLLAQARKNICVVGDDDQSIYSWRGAEIANILRFEKDFSGAKIIKLEQNYRSTQHILGAASGLITENSQRLGKTLWTEMQGGDKVRVYGVWDAPEEARRVSDDIERLEREDANLDEIAILVRAQYQTREFEERFLKIGMNYRILAGQRFYERAEIRDAIAYLRVIAQPRDALAFERIYNQPKRGLGATTLAKMHAYARQFSLPLTAAADQMAQTGALPKAAAGKAAQLMASFARWRADLETTTPAELLRQVLEECGYNAMLLAENTPEAKGRLENLSELARAIEDYETLDAFLEHVSLVMDTDANDSGEKVTIMTMHGAKGLEFDHVYLPGWEEGVFPSQRSIDEGGLASLEEERRLAYVAITRAKRHCTILHAANRQVFGQWMSSLPSRFIGELPADHVKTESSLNHGASGQNSWPHDNDPFAHVADIGRNRGRNIAARTSRSSDSEFYKTSTPAPPQKFGRSAASFTAQPRSDIAAGARVFHEKFGYGLVIAKDGNKLEVEFEHAGIKRVLDSYVEPSST